MPSTPTELAAWRTRLASLAAEHAAGDSDGAHDLNHLDRVWRNARAIMADSGCADGRSADGRSADGRSADTPCADTPVADTPRADMLVVLAACYLHDLVNVPKNDARRRQASTLSAQLARTELVRLGFPHDKLDAVAHAIEAHSFSANIPATTLEAQIVQDADRLDGLGAVGLARMFYIAGRMGSALAHGADPLGRTRALDDKAYSLDHIPVKLARLPGMMQTAGGRRLADARLALLEDFRHKFAEEWSGEDA